MTNFLRNAMKHTLVVGLALFPMLASTAGAAPRAKPSVKSAAKPSVKSAVKRPAKSDVDSRQHTPTVRKAQELALVHRDGTKLVENRANLHQLELASGAKVLVDFRSQNGFDRFQVHGKITSRGDDALLYLTPPEREEVEAILAPAIASTQRTTNFGFDEPAPGAFEIALAKLTEASSHESRNFLTLTNILGRPPIKQ